MSWSKTNYWRWREVLILAASLSLCGLAAAQAPAPATDDTVLAKVDSRSITVGQFTSEMQRRSVVQGRAYATLEERQALLDEMVRREMLVAHALEEGLDRDPEFLAAVYRILISRYTEKHLDQRIERLQVSDAEVRNEFESERSTYRRPERVKGAIIFLEVRKTATSEQVSALEAKAEELRLEAMELDEVTHLGDLAMENSDDRATRYTGGVLPWMIAGQNYKWGDEVVDALFAIDEVGGVAPVVRTEAGFYIVRLAARDESEELPFEMYEAGIRRRLLLEKQRQERERFYQEMEARTEISVNSGPLSEIPGLEEGPATEEKRPPALPGGENDSDVREPEKVGQ
jgi:parvulin-like peptidyl-prolyl isomerase